MIRRPLDHPDQRFTSAALRDIVEEIAASKAAAVRLALGVNLVGCDRDFPDFRTAEKAPDYGVSVPVIIREHFVIGRRFGDPQLLRVTHDLVSRPHAGYINYLT